MNTQNKRHYNHIKNHDKQIPGNVIILPCKKNKKYPILSTPFDFNNEINNITANAAFIDRFPPKLEPSIKLKDATFFCISFKPHVYESKKNILVIKIVNGWLLNIIHEYDVINVNIIDD